MTNDSYGNPRHHFFNDVDGDGDGDSSDLTTIQNLDGDVIIDATYNVEADIDRDGDIDTDDYNLANVSGTDTALAKGVLTTTGSGGVDNQLGFSGHIYNVEVGLYLMRMRFYSPEQGRFIERDPAGYIDGMNLYE